MAIGDIDDLAADIYRVAHLTGSFTLRSGVTAAEYFDKYRFESRPDLLRQVADRMADLVPSSTEILAGLELGGVPIATALSLRVNLPVVFARKEPKAYGTRQIVEGADVAGRRVLVIEDVVSSAGQIVASTNDIRKLGATVDTALCVVDRESGGRDALADIGVNLISLYTASDLANAAA